MEGSGHQLQSLADDFTQDRGPCSRFYQGRLVQVKSERNSAPRGRFESEPSVIFIMEQASFGAIVLRVCGIDFHGQHFKIWKNKFFFFISMSISLK